MKTDKQQTRRISPRAIEATILLLLIELIVAVGLLSRPPLIIAIPLWVALLSVVRVIFLVKVLATRAKND